MKRCTKCKILKPLSEFSKNQSRCKQCNAEDYQAYRQTEKGRAARKAAKQRYRKTEKGRAARQAYDQRAGQTEKGRAANQRREASRREKCPEHRQATNAVARAVASGKLPHVSTVQCACCDHAAQEYHHESYVKEHQLDVFPLCRECHTKTHAKQASSSPI